MILSKPLIGTGGNVLLNEGIELKAAMISRLKNWGIPFVTIQGEEERAVEEQASINREVQLPQLDRIFVDTLNHPLMKIVYDATFSHLQERQHGNG